MTDQQKPEKSLIDFSARTPIKNYAWNRNRKRKDLLKFCLEADLKYNMKDATRRVEEAGFRNRRGKPMSFQAIRNFSEQYIVLYPDEARNSFQNITGEYPFTPAGEAGWLYTLISVAVRYFKSKANFIRWAVQYRVYKSGFWLFWKHYNLAKEEYNAFDEILQDYTRPPEDD